MKHKKGFTLVEVIAVIAVLALLMILVMPDFLNTSSKARTKAYTTKLELIKTSAIMYGQDNYRDLINRGTANGDEYSITMKISDLVPEYLEKDNEDAEKGSWIDDPREPGLHLDNCEIKITANSKSRKVSAEPLECAPQK